MNAKKRYWSSSAKRRRGAAAIEFAMTLPFCLAFFLSLVAIVQACVIQIALENASYFAARKAILPSSTNEEIKEVIQREIAMGLVSDFEHSVTRGGDRISVTVSASPRGFAWITSKWAPQLSKMTRSCTLRLQTE